MEGLRSNNVCIKLKALIYFFLEDNAKEIKFQIGIGFKKKPKKSGTQEKKITDSNYFPSFAENTLSFKQKTQEITMFHSLKVN